MILYGICCGILGSSFAVAIVLLRILFAVASDVESAVESVVGYVVR
jgi:phage shock protein PspC (stress-responsive transcriptional regulator)